MIKNNKGQALVEFAILLPIIILFICSLVDFSLIIYQKNHLESLLDDATTMYRQNLTENSVENIINKASPNKINVTYIKESQYVTIKVEEDVKLITPVTSAVLPNPYHISTKRVIYHE